MGLQLFVNEREVFPWKRKEILVLVDEDGEEIEMEVLDYLL